MFLRPLILAAIVGLFAANASAAVLFSTLGQSSDEVFPPINSTDVWVATDFTTGAQGVTINSIRTALINNDSISHSFEVALYDSNLGEVGTLLTTFSSASLAASTAGTGNYVNFTHAGASLAANTTYWVVLKMLEAVSTDSPYWWLNYGDDTDAGSSFTTVAATAPKYTTDAGGGWNDYGSGNFRMEINGFTVVPEPSRAVLALAGLLGICFRRRR